MKVIATIRNTQTVLQFAYNRSGKFVKMEVKKGALEGEYLRQIGQIIPPMESLVEEWQGNWAGRVLYSIEAEKEKAPTLYSEFLSAWLEFYQQFAGVKPRFNAVEGKCLKEIIKYFQEIAKDDSEALQTWKILLQNWQNLDTFHQKNTDLKYINGNLNKILQNAKQLTANGSKSKYSDSFKRKIFDALQPR